MKRQESEMIKKAKGRLSSATGVTMVELLVVVAIITILSGVAFIAVWNYQRSMGQLERDNIAKEIFIAAQNHLTVAKGEGYRGVTAYGTLGNAEEDSGKGVYYYVVNNGAASSGADMLFAQMLPFGSIDETVRGGGSYLIRYQPKMGLVLDVFYCSSSGSPSKFNHNLLSTETYADVIALKGDHKKDRRTYVKGGNSILGWYGGEDAANLPTLTLSPPDIKVLNRETLSVKVKDTSSGGGTLRLLIKGAESEVEHYLNITTMMTTDLEGYYTLVLDDITSQSQSQNLHFCKRHYDDMGASLPNGFIPGEDITVQAVAYSTTALANISYSAALTTNSLFASVNDSNSDGVPDTAYISNFRHLENLDKDISGLGYQNGTTYSNKIDIVSAVQTTDLNWTDDSENNLATYWTTATITDVDGIECASAGCYVPISPQNEGKIGGYSCTYNGQNHSISNVTASDTDAGLFGNASYMSQISNLELIDFTITGTTSAGALAGTLEGCKVTNVLARNSTTASSAATISAPTAGGLVGSIGSGTTIQYSAAAVVVSGSSNAGGLIGSANGGTITGCYSGGHTKNGSYELWLNNATPDDATDDPPYDVTGATAGGLIGDAGSATISNSYSTCSVSGTTAAGGFVGSGSGSGGITNCYATGLVSKSEITTDNDRETNKAKGAFAGSLTGTTASNCRYYSIVNEVLKSKTVNGETTKTLDHYLGAVGDTASTDITAFDITAFDLNAETFNTFTGAWEDWAPAKPYDSTLVGNYGGKYNLKAILRPTWSQSTVLNPDGTFKSIINPASGNTGLVNSDSLDGSAITDYFVSTHYGDWPSPEVFFINTK